MADEKKRSSRYESSEDLYGDWDLPDPVRKTDPVEDLFSEESYSRIFSSGASLPRVIDESGKEMDLGAANRKKDPYADLYGEMYDLDREEVKADESESAESGKEEEEKKELSEEKQKKHNRIVFLVAMGVIMAATIAGGLSIRRIVKKHSAKTIDEQVEEFVLEQETLEEEEEEQTALIPTELITRPEVSGDAQKDLQIPGWRGFVLCSGHFATQDSAQFYAQKAKQNGYAGYLVQTEEEWQMYSEAYLDEDEANKAASAAGTARVDLNISAQTLTIQGSEQDVEILERAVAQWPDLIKSMTAAVKKAAAGDISQDEALISAKEIEAQLEGMMEELSVTDVHGNLWAREVYGMYEEAHRALSDVVEEGSFSGPLTWSRMRFTAVSMYFSYSRLIQEFAAQE